jgi:TonB family protein
MATSTTQKWLIGCGVGCATLIVLVIGLVTSGVLFVRSKIQPLQEAAESHKTVVSAYGARESYTPPANGALASERMEAFLAVRDALKDAQGRLDAGLAGFDLDRIKQRQPSFRSVLGVLNDISNLLIPIGEYIKRRNEVLVEKRMGLGEYAYIYTIAYNSWLGHPPSEGPPILEKLESEDRNGSFRRDSNINPEAVRSQYRRLVLRLLGNQLNSLKETETSGWRKTLKEEIDRLERDPDRIAWKDNMPPAIEESLKPYRGRLMSTYSSAANFLEFVALENYNRSQWSWEVETGSRNRSSSEPVEALESKRDAASREGIRSEISYEVRSGMTAPEPIRQPLPDYTEEAKKTHAGGVVSLQATVQKDGSLTGLSVVRSPDKGLDETAIKTLASQWKFKPATLNGNPVDVRAKIDIIFR